MSALSPEAARALALRLLEAEGFALAACNERGDSLYLTRPGEDWSLRVSNHARRPKQRRGHPEVLASLILRTPKTAPQVAAMVAAAIRDFSAMRLRRSAPADQASAESSRK
ncbi:hypothetical protein MMB17_20870 [Methylobacterium organophilum]|uniref:hypothetical protein n=1 Tax=Methylobacterium organophilum TaxID=410 RepID=UPI001F12B2A4|nr:hypothetical protein [Methylobacterium organophilum]UMY17073.1 hypothetical protein MMB17_20870 [Methylobacterium organophilum]